MNVTEFQDKLKEICKIGMENGKLLTQEQIRSFFADADLDTEQLLKLLQYIRLQGITIEGMEQETEGREESREPETKKMTGTRVPLTPEEQHYLEQYLEGLHAAEEITEKEEELFRQLEQGMEDAQAKLLQIYLPKTAQLAAEMNCEEIYLADLIQEANIALLDALNAKENTGKNGAWLEEQIRKGIFKAVESQTEQKFQDDYLVAKVEKLEAAVKDLTDEDGETRFTVDELAVILDMKVEEIRDILRLTGDDDQNVQ